MKGFTETKRRRYSGPQPGTKSGRRPADKPLYQPRVNRLFLSSCGLNRISFVRACEESFRTVVFDALGGERVGCVLGKPTRRRLVLPGPAPPRRPALRCPEPIRPWYVRVLDSTGRVT